MKKLVSIAVIVFVKTVFAQTFIAKKNNTTPVNLVAIQQRFDEWAKTQDLSKAKGWKVYKRWENEYAKYADGKGDLPSPINYLTAINNAAQIKNNNAYKSLGASWSPVGPFVKPSNYFDLDQYNMGRINCVAFHPTDTNTLFVGVGQGGIWKSTNNGQTWTPLTDNSLPILRISDIAIDPLQPNTMYASVGDYSYIGIAIETDGRKRNTHYGLGVYKTTDGGNTWSPTGLSFAITQLDGSLSRKVVIDPVNTQNLVAATTAGVFKSTDGGQNWAKTLDSLMWDMEQDPVDPNILYAASGFVASLSEGSAGIWKSTDFGGNWTLLNTGIPARDTVQRINISISSKDPNYIYAVCCDMFGGFGGLYRSTNGGNTWSLQSSSPNILHWSNGSASGGQGTYDLAILADPKDTNKVYVGGININCSIDGGITWNEVLNDSVTPYVHVDQHSFDYNPLNSTYYICNDGGIYKADSLSPDTANKILSISDGLAIRSFYRVGLCDDYEGFVISGAHDNGTAIRDTTGEWHHLFGGDGMKGLIHPHDPQKIYFSYQYGVFFKSDDFGITPNYMGVGGNERGEWTTPMVFHPNNPDTMYSAYGNVWRSEDGGNNWQAISAFDSINGQWPNPSTSIVVAPSNTNYIYLTKRVYHQFNAHSEAWVSKDNGLTWIDITAGLPDSAFLMSVAVSSIDANVAWITCAGLFNGVKVFKTTDAGATWTNISYNLPNVPANAIVYHKGTSNNAVYVATDMGIYYINDNLTSWQPYNTNLPNVIVTDLAIHDKTQKLWASTFGRGMWMSDLQDDLTSANKSFLRSVDAQILPNLNHGEFVLVMNNIQKENYWLRVVDITGKQVWSERLTIDAKEFRQQLKLPLQSGVYFMLIGSGNSQRSLKFVVE